MNMSPEKTVGRKKLLLLYSTILPFEKKKQNPKIDIHLLLFNNNRHKRLRKEDLQFKIKIQMDSKSNIYFLHSIDQ